jgi:GT2 family glycosyltransferase
MEDPLVSILIVTWNRKEDILETIQLIYDQVYQNFEIIVVDNGSTDGTVEALRDTYPEVKLIVFDRNKGICSGRNAGITSARGDIFFCLDSDASPDRDTLTNVVDRFKIEPEIGVINSKILNAYTNKIDLKSGWVYTEKDKADQDKEFLSYSFSEGGCAIKREVIEKVGLFWDFLFFGCEGLDYSLRVWDAGYKVLYYPKSIVYHRASPDKRVLGGEREALFLRNTLYIYLIHYPWWMLIAFVPLKTAASLLRGTKRGYLKESFHALFTVLQQLPYLWRQRKPISNTTAFRYLQLQRQHGPLRWDLASWFKYKT